MANAADLNQLLGTHAIAEHYNGSLAPNDGANVGVGGTNWGLQLSTQDVDMPVTLTGTSLGHVVMPLLCVGDGADLLVSLCADSSGSPGTLITQTRMPKEWIYQLSAVSGVSGPASAIPTPKYTNNPLATAQFNSWHLGTQVPQTWTYPTGGGGTAAGPSTTSYGNYLIQTGGFTGSTYFSNVYSIPFDGAGNLSQAIPQPPIPVATNGAAGSVVVADSGGNTSLIVAGGSTSGGLTSAVWSAGFNSATGAVSAWSSQTALPVPLEYFGMAAYNGYVYVVGGQAASSFVNTVYYAQVTNGQVGAWHATVPLPESAYALYAYEVNGFLVVFGGATNFSSPTASLNTYYAVINPNGTIGSWLPGPSLPTGAAVASNAQPAAGTWGIIGSSSNSLFFELGFTPSGPDIVWREAFLNAAPVFSAVAPAGDGLWQYYGLNAASYITAQVALTPMISVPLAATGLTNNGTYHVVMQQQGGDLNNYLCTHLDNSVQNLTTTLQTSPRNAYTWTAATPALTQVPLELWRSAPAYQNEMFLHTWEDNGARITTTVKNTTPDHALIGICEATSMVTAGNSNTGFETTLSPWTCTGGTAVRSNAEAFEGQWSCQITPSGSATQVYMQSETLPCLPGQSITASCWVWTTSAVTTNFSMSVNWYTSGGVLISTSSNSVSIPASTWTLVTNTFTATTSGGGGFQYSLQPTLSGTPAAGQIWYVDNAIGGPAYAGQQLASVAQVNYPVATWPAINPLKPTGTTVLA